MNLSTTPKFLIMLKRLFAVLLISALPIAIFAQNDSTANAQHQLLGMSQDNQSVPLNNHPLAQWFPKAGLGLFIHWGAITQYAGCDISWGMLANKSWDDDGTVTPNFYYGLMDKWAPKNFDPYKLAKMAKAAGFKYMVFVTKHHDGYTMWPSKYSDLGVQTKMKGHDFVKEYVDACRKEGLKVGLYYSPPDWWFDRKYKNWSLSDSVFLDMDHHKTNPVQKPADHDARRAAMVANQIRELLSNYGKIDLLFFDGGNREISNEEVRKLQPGIVINNRNRGKGDYGDSEGKLPEKRFSGWFETNDPLWTRRWWSYTTGDSYDSGLDAIIELIKIRAWGGNLLGNLAPDADGNTPPQAVQAMKEMSEWMKTNGEAIYDTKAGNYPEKSNVPVTVKGNKVYAFFITSFQGTATIQNINKPTSAILIRNGAKIPFEYNTITQTLRFTIPPALRTRMPDVVEIK
jgi:alpha-L-fucosidase